MSIVALMLAFFLGMVAQRFLDTFRGQPFEYVAPPPANGAPGLPAILENAMPLEEIIERLNLPPGSRILEIETELKKGKMAYEIEWLSPDERVMEIYVDPYTAEILTQKNPADED